MPVVMAGHSRSKNGVASLAYVPAIRVFPSLAPKTWMPGTRFTLGLAEGQTRVPGMTETVAQLGPTILQPVSATEPAAFSPGTRSATVNTSSLSPPFGTCTSPTKMLAISSWSPLR
jgi:hypothetical protein